MTVKMNPTQSYSGLHPDDHAPPTYGFIITVHLLFCCFAVCPVPKNKEEEEIIKEQERNREEMEEIMREIEISCLGE